MVASRMQLMFPNPRRLAERGGERGAMGLCWRRIESRNFSLGLSMSHRIYKWRMGVNANVGTLVRVYHNHNEWGLHVQGTKYLGGPRSLEHPCRMVTCWAVGHAKLMSNPNRRDA